MKRGCLFYLIFFAAIFAASLYYVFNVHQKDIITPVESKIKFALYNKIINNLQIKMERSVSDSLKNKIKKIKISLGKNLNKLNYFSLKKIYKDLNKIIKQKIPDLNKLSSLEKKIEQYGKQKN